MKGRCASQSLHAKNSAFVAGMSAGDRIVFNYSRLSGAYIACHMRTEDSRVFSWRQNRGEPLQILSHEDAG